MRAVVQRVSRAKVTVGGQVTGEIPAGLVILLGVGREDTPAVAAALAEKAANLRIFEDEAQKMNRSVLDGSRAILVVSQFTLYGDARKGRRPSFIEACEPAEANRLYELFCRQSRALGLVVQQGEFAAHMKVALVNDGPVTLILDSRDR